MQGQVEPSTRDSVALKHKPRQRAGFVVNQVLDTKGLGLMESVLRNPAPLDPTNLSRMDILQLAVESEKERMRLKSENDALKSKAEGLDRIATADGSMCMTNAAKLLQVRRKDLISWLQSNGWIYKRQGSAPWLGYRSKVQPGYLEHKVTTVYRNDGTEKITEAVRVTPKGLTRLSVLVPGATVPAQSSEMMQ